MKGHALFRESAGEGQNGADRLILFAKDCRHGAAAGLRIMKRGGEARRIFERRLMRKKWSHSRKIVKERKMQRRLMRKFAKREGATLHGFLDDTRRIR